MARPHGPSLYSVYRRYDTGYTLTSIHQTVVIFILYITAIGYVMIGAGINIDEHDDENEVDRNLKASFDLLFTGGFLTTVFWVSTLSLITVYI